MKRNGGCACGAVRFEIDAPLMGVGACHCTDCQKASGGGPNYVALVPKQALTLTSGKPRLFYSKGDSGAEVARAFCENCGTPLWSVPPDQPFLTVKVGALDECGDLAPHLHIYVSSAPGWHPITDGLPTFPKMPPAG